MIKHTKVKDKDGETLYGLTKSQYEYLEKRLKFLCALENWGVDNWDGFSLAYRDVYGNGDDDE